MTNIRFDLVNYEIIFSCFLPPFKPEREISSVFLSNLMENFVFKLAANKIQIHHSCFIASSFITLVEIGNVPEMTMPFFQAAENIH